MFQANSYRYNRIYKKYILNFFRRDNRLFGLVFFIFFLIFIAICMWKLRNLIINLTVSMPLSHLFISGERFYTSDYDIKEFILKLSPIGNFITQDLNLIQEKIQNISWINKVSVRKQWPNKIKIHIIEYIPVVRWNNSLFLNIHAIPFYLPEGRIVSKILPMLFGPEGSEKYVLSSYHIFDEILKCIKLDIKYLRMNTRYSWRITLQNDLQLVLGRKNNIEQLKRFVKIYPIFFQNTIDRNCKDLKYIDLRYKSGFSVGRNHILDQK